MFFCVCLVATFPGWHEEEDGEHKPFPSRPVSQVALAAVFTANLFLLVSALWQHTAAVAAATTAEALGYGSVKSRVGASAMVLVWAAFAITTLVTIGLLVMILSMHLVEKLVDED